LFARENLAGLGGDPLFLTGPALPSGTAQWSDRLRFAGLVLRNRKLPRYGVRTALRRRLRGGRPLVPPLPDWVQPEFARRVDLSARWRGVRADWDAPTDHQAMLSPYWTAIFGWSHPGAQGLALTHRFPFFDLRLASFVWQTPLYPWRQDKRLLRQAMRDRLPAPVLERPKTPLYVRNGRVRTDDPAYRLAVLPRMRRWRAGLASGAAIGEYVDVQRMRALVESPMQVPPFPRFENCFTLAHWLQAQERVSTPEETEHVANHPTA
jgi:hypothetical protein